MKKFLLSIIAFLYITSCFAQEKVERKNKLNGFVFEQYHTVIETNKQVKDGLYRAFYTKKVVIATGSYTNDKRTGMWHFFDTKQNLLENYNYDLNKLTYEAPEDTSSVIRYIIDNKITDTDYVTKPIRIGGRYYGYVPYLRLFKWPDELNGANHSAFLVILELLVSPGGRLADYQVHIKAPGYDRSVEINPDILKEEDKVFIPATFNKQPISSRIFIQCYINKYDELDM
jgi:hypothetical protein